MRSPTEAARRRLARALDALLAVSAAVGALTALWWVLATAFGVGLVTFETGSMTPDFPIGSLAVTRPVALADVHVGQVVTVDRGGGMLPITHRVVSVRLQPGGAVVRLKGDANRDPDPFPYRVASLRVVVAPVPAVLSPLAALATPAGSAGVVAVAALAVGWAFWPRRTAARGRRRGAPVPPRHLAPRARHLAAPVAR